MRTPRLSRLPTIALLTAFIAFTSSAGAQEAEPPPAEPPPPAGEAPAAEPAPAVEPAPAPPAQAAPAAEPAAAPATTARPTTTPRKKPEGAWETYTDYVDRKIEFLMTKPIWGITANLPEGVFKFRYEINPATATKMFDRDGTRQPLLPPITFTDQPRAGQSLAITPSVEGNGVGHSFQIGYGISDELNVFAEMPFTEIRTRMTLKGEVREQGQPTRPITGPERQGLEDMIVSNGRPLPGATLGCVETEITCQYVSGMDLGNMHAGVSWNFYRTKYFSTSLVPRVYFPTGVEANANNDLSFLLGSEIDRGTSAWAVNLTTPIDIRPIEYITFNFEVQATYRFGYERDTPDWLPITDCRRLQDAAARQRAGCPAEGTSPNTNYDRAYDLEQREVFPNLEGLGDTYDIEPGLESSFQAGFTLEPGIPIPIQFAYNFRRNEALIVRGKGDPTAAAEFERITKQLQLFEASELHTIGIGTQLPLFPLYIPVAISVGAKWAIAGQNTLILEDNYFVAFEMYLPVGDLWMPQPDTPPPAAE